MRFRRFALPVVALIGAASLSGCWTMADAWEKPEKYVPYYLQPYRADVHQGNLVTSEMVMQLEKGMSVAQVQFLLGIPLVQDQFHRNQWDYVYYLRRGNGQEQLRHLTVYFDENSRVERWESDAMPDETQADQLILGTIHEFAPKTVDTEERNASEEK